MARYSLFVLKVPLNTSQSTNFCHPTNSVKASYVTLSVTQAGYFSKALELAFSSKQYAALHTVSESLDEGTDPLLLQQCADFFIENSQFDRAVDLLAAAHRVSCASLLCLSVCQSVCLSVCRITQKLWMNFDEM